MALSPDRSPGAVGVDEVRFGVWPPGPPAVVPHSSSTDAYATPRRLTLPITGAHSARVTFSWGFGPCGPGHPGPAAGVPEALRSSPSRGAHGPHPLWEPLHLTLRPQKVLQQRGGPHGATQCPEGFAGWIRASSKLELPSRWIPHSWADA